MVVHLEDGVGPEDAMERIVVVVAQGELEVRTRGGDRVE